MRTGSSRLLGGAAAAMVALATAACGSTGAATATGTPAVLRANSVCSALTASRISLDNFRSGALTHRLLKRQLRRAERQLEGATEELKRSLQRQGASAGSLDRLASTLRADVNKIQKTSNAVTSGLVASWAAQLPAFRTELATMGDDLQAAGAELRSFAPSHELEQAFHKAGACRPYLH